MVPQCSSLVGGGNYRSLINDAPGITSAAPRTAGRDIAESNREETERSWGEKR